MFKKLYQIFIQTYSQIIYINKLITWKKSFYANKLRKHEAVKIRISNLRFVIANTFFCVILFPLFFHFQKLRKYFSHPLRFLREPCRIIQGRGSSLYVTYMEKGTLVYALDCKTSATACVNTVFIPLTCLVVKRYPLVFGAGKSRRINNEKIIIFQLRNDLCFPCFHYLNVNVSKWIFEIIFVEWHVTKIDSKD